MSITDELRAWVTGAKPAVVDGCSISVGTMTYGCKKALLAIADSIDMEYQKAIRELNNLAEHSIFLPVDANGVPIRVGDVLTDGEYTFVVDELAAFGGGSWSIRNEDGNAWKACDVTHHHEPTVEDVLRECIANVCRSNAQLYEQGCSPLTMEDIDEELDEYINEYAVRLRLAEWEER